jgi:acyl carrier protein
VTPITPDEAVTLLGRLLARIAPEVDLADIGPEEPIQEAADLDSMDFLNLMTALFEETGVEVPERDYPALSTVAGFAGYVASATSRAH